jgi:hypothetical protein
MVCNEVLYWASRLHASKRETLAEALAYRDRLRQSGPKIDTSIIDALIREAEGDGESAIRILRDADNPDARSALLLTLRRVRGNDGALAWFDDEPGHNDSGFLTGAGWSGLAAFLADAGRWEEAAERLRAVHELHVEDWPDLAFVEGVINAALLLPDDLRRFALTMDLFHPAVRTVEGSEANQRRARADTCFACAADLMSALDLDARAQAARDWRLWLQLTSPEPATVRSAREEVASGMTDGARAVNLIPFARGFGIEFDVEPLQHHLARRKRVGGLEGRELLAELMLAETTMSPRERAEFLKREEDRLADGVARATLLCMRIEALVLDRRAEEARRLLKEIDGELTEHDGARLALMIEAHAGGDPRPGLKDLYSRTGSLIDLQNLVGYLGRAADWTALRPYLEELFRRERTSENARRVVDGMRRDTTTSEADLLAFLEANTDLIAGDNDLASEKAWALFHVGRLEEAQQVNDRLLAERSSERDLALDLNIALQTGDWERFPAIVNREWDRREAHKSQMLLRLASLASEADATADRAFELARLAAARAPDDPHVLVGAYILATQLGREADADPQWIARASRMSSEHGPAWAVDARTVIEEMMPAHRERVQEAHRLWMRGEIPIHVALTAFNASLSRLLLDLPRRTSEERDGRHKAIVPVVSGARRAVDIQEGWTVGLDATSLMVLSHLGLLRKAIKAFAQVALAPDTMILLLGERRHARFHQPSRLQDAEELRGLIDRSKLRAAHPLPTPPAWLLDEVDRDLAELLEAARTSGGRVVHPFPIHKRRTFLEREAELNEYRDVVVSTVAFARMLHDGGYIDSETYARGESYLRARNRADDTDATHDPAILGQPVYLDSLGLTYLQTAGVLRPACMASLDLRVHPTLRDEQIVLIEVSREGEALAEAISRIRLLLRQALIEKRTTFLSRHHPDNEDEQLESLMATASTLVEFMRNSDPCDAICLDDRWINQNATLTDQVGKTVPVVCVLDILRFLRAQNAIGEGERLSALHKLRDAGFALVPVEADELEARLRAAPQGPDGVFAESAELRAIRQNLMRIRGLDLVRPPKEEGYLASLSLASAIAIRKLWEDEDVPVDRVLACTDWVWRNVAPSPLDWMRSLGDRGVTPASHEAFADYLWLWLTPMPLVPFGRYNAYRTWVARTILEPLLPANADLVDAVAACVGSEIERLSEGLSEDET